jgi:hypothetical protein
MMKMGKGKKIEFIDIYIKRKEIINSAGITRTMDRNSACENKRKITCSKKSSFYA